MPLRSCKQLNGKSIITFNDGCELIYPNRGLILLTKRTLLNIGMLLRDSKVAKELRRILDIVHDSEDNKGSPNSGRPWFVGKDIAKILGYLINFSL